MINALQAILPGGRPVISNKQNTMHCPANCPFSSSALSEYVHQFFPVEAMEPLPWTVNSAPDDNLKYELVSQLEIDRDRFLAIFNSNRQKFVTINLVLRAFKTNGLLGL